MCAHKMHADEVDTDVSLVSRLLAAQFPHWAHLPIEAVRSAGTDNAIYRLGDDMAVRLPRIHWAIAQVDKEQQWLPKLAPHLPLAIPVPLGKGVISEGLSAATNAAASATDNSVNLVRMTRCSGDASRGEPR